MKLRLTLIILISLVLIALIFDIGLRLTVFSGSSPLPYAVAEPLQDLYLPNAYGKLKPNLLQEVLSYSNTGNFELTTNEFGMRSPEVDVKKDPNITRIAIMGDSIAFGWGLPQEKAFPARLRENLKKESNKKFEVLNFAAPGFTSFHAVKQYEQLVHNFKPDILILAFGLFDSHEARLSEGELYAIYDKHDLINGLSGITEWLNKVSTISHWNRQETLKQAKIEIDALINQRTKRNQWVDRVSPESFYQNISAILNHYINQQKGKAILVNLNLLNFKTLDQYKKLANDFDVPLFDVRALFDQLGGEKERAKSFSLDLQPAGFDRKDQMDAFTFLFRIYVPLTVKVPDSIYIAGNHPKLGNNIPNLIPLNDKGNARDEKANDQVWSLEITLDQPEILRYTFTNSGEKGQWNALNQKRMNKFKNQLFFFQVDPTHLQQPAAWSSLLYFYGKVPFDYLLQTQNPQYPNPLGHQTISNRLTYLILELM